MTANTSVPSTSSSDYLLKRKLLPQFIGPISLGGFTLGIVFSGIFFGWEPGLPFGWANMIAAFVLATVMYGMLVLSVSEMCAALPFTSGLSTFAQTAFNPTMFAFSGALNAIQFTLFPAVLLVSSGVVIEFIFVKLTYGIIDIPSFVYWLPLPVLTVLLHCRPRLLFRVTLILSIHSSVLLLVYLFIIIFIQDPHTAFVTGRSVILQDIPGLSVYGIIRAFPFACTLYNGIDLIPSASEETKKICKTAPKVVLWCFAIVVFFSIGLLATVPDQSSWDNYNSSHVSVYPSFFYDKSPTEYHDSVFSSTRVQMLDSEENPRLVQFLFSLRENALRRICSRFAPSWCMNIENNTTILALIHLLAVFPPLCLSFIAVTYVSARHIYFLSRSGILPSSLSHTHSGAPVLATCAAIVAALISVGIVDAINWVAYLIKPEASLKYHVCAYALVDHEQSSISQVTKYNIFEIEAPMCNIIALNWVACLAFVIKFGIYVALYFRVPNLPRPFLSPFGVTGAYVGLVIAILVGIVGPVFNCPFFYGSLLAILFIVMAIGTLYWVFVAKVRVADSPEKIFIRHQLKQIWGRSFSVQRTPTQIFHQRTQTQRYSGTVMLNPAGVTDRPFADSAHVTQELARTVYLCNTTVLLNGEGTTDPRLTPAPDPNHVNQHPPRTASPVLAVGAIRRTDPLFVPVTVPTHVNPPMLHQNAYPSSFTVVPMTDPQRTPVANPNHVYQRLPKSAYMATTTLLVD